MEATVLQTKLYSPPIRSALVPRPQLIAKINQGISGKLTLVSAPAGFGKTTLVVAWLNQQESRIAWISLDEYDDDPRRFFTYLITACQQNLPDFDSDLLRLLQLPVQDIGWQQVVTAVLNEITKANTPFILVLDDFQHVQSTAIQEALTFWLDHQPPNLHLVMTTRFTPNLPLSRLRARDQINEINLDDLRFSPQEMDRFFSRVPDLALTEKDLRLLMARTEGWPAGLQLVAAAMRSAVRTDSLEPSQFIASFSGSNRLVLDYLTDEVLAQQSEETHHFLIHTAILDRFCAPLCAALFAEEPGDVATQKIMLQQLDEANLFIMPLDQERRWYRYHPLFADFLRGRLQATQSAQIPLLHNRASRWFAANGMKMEAVSHAFAADDETAVSHLLTQLAPDMIRQGEVVRLNRWLQQLSPTVRQTTPQLDLYLALAKLLAGDFTNLAEIMTLLDGATDRLQTAVSPEKDRLLAEANAIRATLLVEKGDTVAGLALAEPAAAQLALGASAYGRYLQAMLAAMMGLAYRDLGKTETAVRHYAQADENRDTPTVLLLAAYEQGKLLEELGRLHEAVQVHQRALAWSQEQFGTGAAAVPLTGAAHIGLGRILYEWNRLDEASEQLGKGIARTAQHGGLGIDRDGLLALAFVRQTQGNSAEANEWMAKAVAHARQSPRADAGLSVDTQQARLWLLQGNLAAAAQWASQQTIGRQNAAYPSEITAVSLAQVYLAQQQPERALAILTDFLPVVKAGERYGRLTEMWLLQAIAYQQVGELDKAIGFLEQSLNWAAQEGYVRLFLNVGERVVPLLKTAVKRNIFPDTSSHLLTLLTSASPLQTPATTTDLVESLSEREVEVLQWVAEGLTNREIGLRLHLSPNTIKRHTLNIYEKLNVHNRTEAVNQARQLGIIS